MEIASAMLDAVIKSQTVGLYVVVEFPKITCLLYRLGLAVPRKTATGMAHFSILVQGPPTIMADEALPGAELKPTAKFRDQR